MRFGVLSGAAAETGFLRLRKHSVRREAGVSQAAEKLTPEGGGGFNPRITPAKSARALAPEEILAHSPDLVPKFQNTSVNDHTLEEFEMRLSPCRATGSMQ
jgi:hypothetical protein